MNNRIIHIVLYILAIYSILYISTDSLARYMDSRTLPMFIYKTPFVSLSDNIIYIYGIIGCVLALQKNSYSRFFLCTWLLGIVAKLVLFCTSFFSGPFGTIIMIFNGFSIFALVLLLYNKRGLTSYAVPHLSKKWLWLLYSILIVVFLHIVSYWLLPLLYNYEYC